MSIASKSRIFAVLALVGTGLLALPGTGRSHSTQPETHAFRAQVKATPTSCSGAVPSFPNGTPVDLTGAWLVSTTVYYVRQIGDCIWWVSLSDYSTAGLSVGGLTTTTVFAGQLSPGGTLSGQWVTVPRGRIVRTGGTATLRVTPGETGGRASFSSTQYRHQADSQRRATSTDFRDNPCHGEARVFTHPHGGALSTTPGATITTRIVIISKSTATMYGFSGAFSTRSQRTGQGVG